MEKNWVRSWPSTSNGARRLKKTKGPWAPEKEVRGGRTPSPLRLVPWLKPLLKHWKPSTGKRIRRTEGPAAESRHGTVVTAEEMELLRGTKL